MLIGLWRLKTSLAPSAARPPSTLTLMRGQGPIHRYFNNQAWRKSWEHPRRRRLLLLNGGTTSQGGFFDQLKKSLQKEVEQNKEFKESLSKLRKETNSLTDKAQEKLKVGTGARQYAEGVSSKGKEAMESARSFLGSLREKVLPNRPVKKEDEKPQQSATSRARAAGEGATRARRRQGAPSPPTAGSQDKATATSTSTNRTDDTNTSAASSSSSSTSSTAASDDAAASEGDASKFTSSSERKEDQQPPPHSEAGSSGTKTWSERVLQGRDMPTALRMWSSSLYEGVREAAVDLFGLKEQSTGMKKRIYEPTAAPASGGGEGEAAAPEGDEGGGTTKPGGAGAGGGALVVVKVSDGYWFAEQLKDAPLIKEILKAGKQFANTELGKKAQALRGKVHDKVEDAREMWETSQNPLVYKLSSMWDDLTSETELGVALKEIRRSDPEFVMEDWVNNISERFLPTFFESYLRGDLKVMAPYLSEGMYKSLAEEFRMRKAEGLVLDPNVLEISNTEVLQAKITDGAPMLMVGTLIQHINCVRNRDGAVVDGKEDEVRASFYLLLFTRSFNDVEGVLEWKVAERMLGYSERFI